MPINWSKWGSREDAFRAFVDHLDKCATEALSTGAKYQDPYERARLEVARKEVRASFDYLVEHLLDRIENIELRRLGYEGILQFATAAFEIGVYGTYTATNKNFFEEIVLGEQGSRARKASWNERKQDHQALQKYGLELANEIRATKPHLSQSDLAEEMRSKWKVKPKLKFGTLVEHISAWENSGLLPKRVPKPKEPAGWRK